MNWAVSVAGLLWGAEAHPPVQLFFSPRLLNQKQANFLLCFPKKAIIPRALWYLEAGKKGLGSAGSRVLPPYTHLHSCLKYAILLYS